MAKMSGRNSGPPAWFVFLLGIALVFGLYYLWIGTRSFFRSEGLGISAATARAEAQITATVIENTANPQPSITSLPTNTPVPECQDFMVIVASAIVRDQPSTSARLVNTYDNGEVVCVIAHDPDGGWYLIDNNPITRRLEPAYMHEDLLEAVSPTLTPTDTQPPPPTVTLTPLPTATETPLPGQEPTRTPTSAPPTHTPAPAATPTSQSVNI